MKTQAPSQSRLQLVKFTVARLNDVRKTGSNKGFAEPETTTSTASCLTIII